MQKLNAQQFMQVLPSVIKNGGAIYHRAASPLVHVGLTENIDEEYCIQNNIPIFRVKRAGGPIVSNTGDFDFVIVNQTTNRKAIPPLFQKLIHFLISKNVNANFERNDLLVDGYKVASYAYSDVPGGTYTAIHISMSVNMDLIKNICQKEMVKVPKGLKDFGITEEDIESML